MWSGLYRWATEEEYRQEVDRKALRPRRKEDAVWEFEFVRRRLVFGGMIMLLL